MSLSIRQIGPCFVGEASGLDLTKPLSQEDYAAIHAGMDQYGVLIFHGQDFTDESQLAFTQGLGPMEIARGTCPLVRPSSRHRD